MASIGIIANPASGKDIRRLVSYATTIDNQEKVNIVKRIVLAAQAMGVDTVWFMPDTFQIGWTVISDLSADGRLTAACRLVEIPLHRCSWRRWNQSGSCQRHKTGSHPPSFYRNQ